MDTWVRKPHTKYHILGKPKLKRIGDRIEHRSPCGFVVKGQGWVCCFDIELIAMLIRFKCLPIKVCKHCWKSYLDESKKQSNNTVPSTSASGEV